MAEIFVQFGIILGIAVLVSFVMKALKQPLIIGYIITGIIIGPAVSSWIDAGDTLQAFSHMGIALLLFIVGLGLRPNIIKEIGKVAAITGIAQVIITTLGGYFLGLALELTPAVAFYLGFTFSLSSTIIVLQLLYQKREQDSLYGRISIGFLLVQDLVAMFFFIFLSSMREFAGGDYLIALGLLLAKVLMVVLAVFILIKYVVPRIDKLFAGNHELLFVFALAVCFLMAAVFYKLNFSLELGALVAGVLLSVSPFQREIAARLHSLRDFFLIMFFIIIGMNINFQTVDGAWGWVMAYSLFILIGNPLILFFIMRWLRFTTRTSFLTGLTVAQISEFSLIIIAMGIGLGHLPAEILGPATLVGVITMAVSTYFITHNHGIYKSFEPILRRLFPDRHGRAEKAMLFDKYDVIIFGCHRLGGGLAKELKKVKINYIIVDHDPDVIKALTAQKIPCLYGSADNIDLMESLPFEKCKLVISTIPDPDVNLTMLAYLRSHHRRVNFIGMADHAHQARELYRAGATYVIMPHYLGRRYIVDLFHKNKLDLIKYKKEKNKHMFDLPLADSNNRG